MVVTISKRAPWRGSKFFQSLVRNVHEKGWTPFHKRRMKIKETWFILFSSSAYKGE
ncbi:MAG: hypothetical protein AAF443_07995 [Chlamydiota bacterium]